MQWLQLGMSASSCMQLCRQKQSRYTAAWYTYVHTYIQTHTHAHYAYRYFATSVVLAGSREGADDDTFTFGTNTFLDVAIDVLCKDQKASGDKKNSATVERKQPLQVNWACDFAAEHLPYAWT